MKVNISLIFLLFIVLSACNDDTSSRESSTSEEQSDEDIAVLQPYLDDPVMETSSSGVRKLGLYSEANDTGTFKDCKTGKSFHVEISNNTHALHSTYGALSHNQGQPLLVDIIAEVKTNNEDEVEVLLPKILLGIIHKQACN